MFAHLSDRLRSRWPWFVLVLIASAFEAFGRAVGEYATERLLEERPR